MKLQPPEILGEKDVLGMDKPLNQLKPSKMKSGGGFLVIAIILLMITAVVVYYLS